MTAPKVLGLDLSVTCTGLAGDGWTDTIRTKPRRPGADVQQFVHARYAVILDRLGDYLAGVDLAVIEKFAPGPLLDMDRQLAALNWMVRQLLWRRGVAYAIVPTSNLKLYAVGKGRRSTKERLRDEAAGTSVKEPVLAAVGSWFPSFAGQADEADAAVLFCMGRDWLGFPAVAVPEEQRKALRAVTWPSRDLLLAGAT